MISRNGVSYGTANTGKSRSSRGLHERGGHALEAEADAEAERARAARLELRHQRALRLRVAAQPHAGRQHDPVGPQPARGRVDLDRVRAAHRRARRVRTAGHQLEPEGLLGEHVAEVQAGSGASAQRREPTPVGPWPKPPARVSASDDCRAAPPPTTWRPHHRGGSHEPVETKPAPRRSRPTANKTALRAAIAALNAGRPEEYLALFRPDAQLHGFPAGIDDVDALCRFHAATADTFPDASVTLDDAVAEGDRVATRFTWRATQGPGCRWSPTAAPSCASTTARSPSAGTFRRDLHAVSS